MSPTNAVITNDNFKLNESLDKIKHIIMVMSGKGGVGKSTVAANLALGLAMAGHETGIMDVDIHGPNIPKLLGIGEKRVVAEGNYLLPVYVPPRLKVMSMGFLIQNDDTPVIWRGPVKMGVIRQFLEDVRWGDLDFLIVDLPPGTGDEPLSIIQLIPRVDGAIIVTTPQDVALLDSRKSINFCKQMNVRVLGVIENMSTLVCPHCGGTIDVFKHGGGEKAAEEMGVPFLGHIPLNPSITVGGDNGVPAVADVNGTAGEAFMEIIDRLRKQLIEKR
ncbi:MAG: hypothetical protein PWQ88_67 [Candidatus Methanomethylophilaceae archaeon]|nr:hypothetical protein [Candidatus Methanomethylophilaceae archaeon]MDI3541792.1 hypothetical protein [Candidatus Methanomethylophilaceae archaeon]